VRAAVAAAILWWMLSTLPSFAAEPVVSASMWRASGQDVALRFTFPRRTAELLAAPGKPVPATEAVARYVLQRIVVEQDSVPCPAVDQGYDLGRIDTLYVGPDLFGFDILFRCPRADGSLALRNDALFDLSAPHIALASIRLGGAAAVSRLVTSADRTIRIGKGQAAKGSGAGTYMQLGSRHLLTSWVHWCTVCGLLLCARGRRELAFLASGILGGYLIAALAAGASHFVLGPNGSQAWDGLLVLLTAALLMGRTTGELRKPAIGLAIVAGAGALVAVFRGYPDVALTLVGAGAFGSCMLYLWHLGWDHPARWLAPALALGLVDGFALPSELAPLNSAIMIRTTDIWAFNVGAVGAVLALFAAVAAVRWLLLRYASFLKAPVFGDLLAASLAGLGAFYVLVV